MKGVRVSLAQAFVLANLGLPEEQRRVIVAATRPVRDRSAGFQGVVRLGYRAEVVDSPRPGSDRAPRFADAELRLLALLHGRALSRRGGVLEGLELAKTAMRALSRYVPVDLVRTLYRTGREPQLGGELLPVTLLFSDIKGFTALSERLPPNELAQDGPSALLAARCRQMISNPPSDGWDGTYVAASK